MSDAVWAAIIGAVAVILAAVIQSSRGHRTPSERAVGPAPPFNPTDDNMRREATSKVLVDRPQPVAGEAQTKAEAEDTLTAEEVIERLVAEGGNRYLSAQPNHPTFQKASRLRFVRCQCAWDDESYRCHEYIARTPRGACCYIGMSRVSGNITIGLKGYHWYHPEVPECV